jgi:hypothetical protein
LLELVPAVEARAGKEGYLRDQIPLSEYHQPLKVPIQEE